VEHLFTEPRFAGFGPCALDPGLTELALHQVHGKRSSQLRKAVRGACPRLPGVYGMIDQHGDLVYVGKAKKLRARLLSYFRPRSRDRKAGRIVGQTRSLVWEAGPDEFAALHRELELIRRWRPRFNVAGKPHQGQHTYVCLGRAPAPYAYLVRRPPARAVATFGPIRAGPRAAEAVRRLNDWFRLRDCPQAQAMIFADEADLFPGDRAAGCLRLELATCLGPCAGACTRDAYAKRVRAARRFLTGEDMTPLAELEAAMRAASVAQVFERAAVLRDKLAALEWLHRQLEQMRDAATMGTMVYPLAGAGGQILWYVLHAGRAVATVAAPETPPTAEWCAHLRDRVLAHTRRARLGDQVAGIQLLAAWFRKHPEERGRLWPLGTA
jgi:excinuclease ABC subunit C